MNFDARRVKPIELFTADMREKWFETCCLNMSLEETVAMNDAIKAANARALKEYNDKRHQYFLQAAGAAHNAMSIGEAKRYVRARAASSLRQAFEVLEQAMQQAGKVGEKVDIANEIVKRAVGPHAVPNSMTDAKQLTELAPVDAIDAALEAYGRGEIDEAFVKTLLGLLGAKVNGLVVEQELAKKSAGKAGAPLKKPPSGKVV
ncbi:hypothetical protein [Mesorhizobium kowhaii]|nr:hypothetical protein [Mesorhizobium kowhaii]